MRRSRPLTALWLAAAIALATSCGKEAEIADLNLVLIPVVEPDPFGASEPLFKVASLELRGQVGAQVLFRSTVDYHQGGELSLPELTIEDDGLKFPADNVIVYLSGFSTEGGLVAQGSAGPLRLAAGAPATASLIFARADSCSRLAATLNQARWGHTATRLSDGRVLVVGGAGAAVDGAPDGALDSFEIFDPDERGFAITEGAAQAARVFHTATPVSGGVLIAGGLDASGEPLGTAVLFDEQSGTFGGEISIAPRAAHAAAAQGGDVLVAGGVADGPAGLGAIPGFVQVPGDLGAVASVELIQVGGQTSVALNDLPGGARAFPVAATLGDGSAVVAGGIGASGVSVALDHYPKSDEPAALEDLTAARFGGAALTLQGNVLVAGGVGADGAGVASATLVLSDGPTVTPAPEMKQGRAGFGIAPVSASSAVVLAGITESEPAVRFAVSAERYSASAGFTTSGSLRHPRIHAAVAQLLDGAVLAIGGLTPDGSPGSVPALDSVEVYRAGQELP